MLLFHKTQGSAIWQWSFADGGWQAPRRGRWGQWWMNTTRYIPGRTPPGPLQALCTDLHQPDSCIQHQKTSFLKNPTQSLPWLRAVKIIYTCPWASESSWWGALCRQCSRGRDRGKHRARVGRGHREGVVNSAWGGSGESGKFCRSDFWFQFWERSRLRKRVQDEGVMKDQHRGNEVYAAFGGCEQLTVVG